MNSEARRKAEFDAIMKAVAPKNEEKKPEKAEKKQAKKKEDK